MKNRIETLKDREAEHKRDIMIDRHKVFKIAKKRKGSSSPEDYKKSSESTTQSKGKK